MTAPDGSTIRNPVCGAGVTFGMAGGGPSAKADDAKRPAATAIAAMVKNILKPRTGDPLKSNDHHRMAYGYRERLVAQPKQVSSF